MLVKTSQESKGLRLNSRVYVIDDEEEYLALIEAFAATSEIHTIKLDKWSEDIVTQLKRDDLLIIDIRMPDVNGVDILMTLAEHCFAGGIIVMSGSDQDLIDSVCSLAKKLELNYIGTLRKPFRLATFKELIDQFSSKLPADNIYSQVDAEKLSLSELKNFVEKELFFPVYQPQIDSSDGRVLGIECLTRIKSGDLASMPVQLVIQALSKHGLIHSYTNALIEKALSEVGEELNKYSGIQLSFNIEAVSLKRSLVDDFINLIKKYEISFNQITFEITESNAIPSDSEAFYCVSKLRSLGINLSIDDFGTGYSTIQSLADLPFNELKFDRSFILKITENKKALEIVRFINDLSKSLDFKLICEGVDDESQLKKLLEVGCSNIQGYYYSKPLTIDEIKPYLDEKHR